MAQFPEFFERTAVLPPGLTSPLQLTDWERRQLAAMQPRLADEDSDELASRAPTQGAEWAVRTPIEESDEYFAVTGMVDFAELREGQEQYGGEDDLPPGVESDDLSPD